MNWLLKGCKSITLANRLYYLCISCVFILLTTITHSNAQVTTDHFVTTWQTDLDGSSTDLQITIPTTGIGYDYNIIWTDINDPTITGEILSITGDHTIDFPAVGVYEVAISGQFPQIYFNNAGFFGSDTDSEKLLTVEQWGNIQWRSMLAAFAGCSNLVINATDAPDLSMVSDISFMFEDCSQLNSDINHWNVNTVTSMEGVFDDATLFNQPLNMWNVDNVTTMEDMFAFAVNFDQDIGSWTVDNVTNMRSMFGGASSFNQDISGWNVLQVQNMNQMFSVAVSFDQPIGSWSVDNVTDMTSMFSGATVFNQDLSLWNTTKVNSTAGMFRNAEAFNQNINDWDVINVTNMSSMFEEATAFNMPLNQWDTDFVQNMSSMFEGAIIFNQDITGWETGEVQNTHSMFYAAEAFNQDISSWDVGKVRDMRLMFQLASLFNQNLGSWNVSEVDFMLRIFDGSGLSTSNYDNTLIGWSSLTLQNNVSFGAEGISFCMSEAEREVLITNFGWNINDAGQQCITVLNPEMLTIENSQPDPVYFGSAIVNVGKTFNFTIQNLVDFDLTNFNVAITGSVFNVNPIAPSTITANNTEVISIVFNNAIAGNYAETVTISSDATPIDFTFTVSGELTVGPEPEILIFEDDYSERTEIFNGQIDPITFDFGVRGTDASHELIIANKGSDILDITDVTFTGSTFSVLNSLPFSVGIDSEAVLTLVLSGDNVGSFSETMTIVNNDNDEGNFILNVEGEIYGPEIYVLDGIYYYSSSEIENGQPIAIDIGSTPFGNDATKQISIVNNGYSTLNISDLSVSGTAFSTDFGGLVTLVNNSETPILYTFEVTLDGSTSGIFNEVVTITNDDVDNNPFIFNVTGEVTGTGLPEITVYDESTTPHTLLSSGGAVDFNAATLGSDITRSITIENNGSADLNISGIMITGGAFTLASTPPTNISTGGAETIDVILSGNNAGSFAETLTISNNDSDESTFEILLSGIITTSPTPEITVYNGSSTASPLLNSGETIAFNTSVQGSDIMRSFTIENTGNADLNISNLALSGSAFNISSVSSTTITAGEIETYEVTLSGNNVGSFSETLMISSNDTDQPTFEVLLTGMITASAVPEITVFDDSGNEITSGEILDFGIETIGNSHVQPITIENNGTADLLISSISISGTDVTLNATFSNTIAVGSSVTIDLELSKSTVGTFNETLTIATNDSDESAFTINVTGETVISQSPEIMVFMDNTMEINIGDNVDLGTHEVNTLFAQIITIENSGTSDLNISEISISSGNISLNAISPLTIASGASEMIELQLSGSVIENYNEIISIINNDSDESTFNFQVIGIIQASPIADLEVQIDGVSQLTGQTITFDDAPIGTNNERNLLISNTGTAILNIADISIVGEGFSLGNSVPSTIEIGASEILSIIFAPTSAGQKSALLTIDTETGQTFTATLVASGLSDLPGIEIFNVITTQENGKHDYFEIRNIELYPFNEVFIYSRWGDEVYKTSNYNNNSNRFIGKSNNGNSLGEGTYYYVIKLNGGDIRKSGYLLLRN